MPKIKEALNFMKKHSFEVPFITNYRREYVEPELEVHDLWKVLRLDEKVRSMTSGRSTTSGRSMTSGRCCDWVRR